MAKKYDVNITAKKGIGFAFLAGFVDVAVQLLQTAQFDILDMSVRAVLVGGIVAAHNWLKHRK